MDPSAISDLMKAVDRDGQVEAAAEASLARAASPLDRPNSSAADPIQLARLGLLHETAGLSALEASPQGPGSSSRTEAIREFERAFHCWHELAEIVRGLQTTGSAEALTQLSTDIVRYAEPLPLSIAFHIAVCGVLSERTAEVRMVLGDFDLGADSAAADWMSRVGSSVLRALSLLVRKGHGWSDVDEALRVIQELRREQLPSEGAWIAHLAESTRRPTATRLVGLYHLAQIVTLAGEYLTLGRVRDGGGIARLSALLDLHRNRAVRAFLAAHETADTHQADLLWAACGALGQNAIWTHFPTRGPLRELATYLARKDAERPVIELWPAQQRALAERLLDPYPRAIFVDMPTSAGKTLLAKFVIVQTRALTGGTTAYVVPTRALVNQVTFDLRRDLGRALGLRVEQAIPAFELDPTEDRLLATPPDILVTTPEKLDLLVRKGHPAVADLVLLVADEAHNISERGRGARLELLLGMVRRDRPEARFLLLSPFLPPSKDLEDWLSDGRNAPAIRISWRPGKRIVGAIERKRRAGAPRIQLRSLAAASNTDLRPGVVMELGDAHAAAPKAGLRTIVRDAAVALSGRGGVLVLSPGARSAMTRASEIASDLPERSSVDEIERVCRFLSAELGVEPALARCLRRGVAFHHAGLSPEARWLVEGLIRDNFVSVVCGTTTLAQGVNFPISSVVVETLKTGDVPLSYNSFWNIAGRAGRALMDAVGVVGFPVDSGDRLSQVEQFLRGEASEIASQLSGLIDHVDAIGERFDLNTVYNYPEISPLLQFLAHAMKVSGERDLGNSVESVEELLRSSLVYHQARRKGGGGAEKLVQLCRAYLAKVQDMRGVLALADLTGFATPSVLQLHVWKQEHADLRVTGEWRPDRLFGADISPLALRIAAIAQIPEMRLGTEEPGRFSPERVASILRDWVSGKSLSFMASKYAPTDTELTSEQQLTEFSTYLFSSLLGKASWGIGALAGICLAGTESEIAPEVGHVPSMIFYGVRSRQAVWMRMVGVPRVVAEPLGSLWSRQSRGEPQSFGEIRDWVTALSDAEWLAALPTGSPLRQGDGGWLWSQFGGTT